MGVFSMPKTLLFAAKIFDNRATTVPILKTSIDKPKFFGFSPNDLPRCAPEDAGISSTCIKDFLETLASDWTLNIHGVTIARNGKILCEASFGAQRLDVWKYTFSACKSITSLAIGFLIDDGLLDPKDKIVDIFRGNIGSIGKLRLRNLTVEDLLTMRSGALFSELSAITEQDWLSGFLNAPVYGEIGETFRYNSLNTYMLSAIVEKKTGMTLSDFLRERLFTPLGIPDENWFWETCPEGREKGGWGLYMKQDDLVKVAQLVMQKGEFNGKQILSKAYIEAAITPHVEVNTSLTSFDYGYQIWVGKSRESFLFNGLFGQNVLGFLNNGIIIVCNAGNPEVFQNSKFFQHVKEFFDKEFPSHLPAARKEKKALEKYIRTISYYKKRSFWQRLFSQKNKTKQCLDDLSGTKYGYCEGHEKAQGILPFVFQLVQNQYATGFVSLSFKKEDGRHILVYQENGGETAIPLGIDEPCESTLQINGAEFMIATMARFSDDEDGRPILSVKIDFLEFPSSKILKLIFVGKDHVALKSEELPGRGVSGEVLKLILSFVSETSVVTKLVNWLGHDCFARAGEQNFLSELLLKKETK